jgi:hypothetical protein
MLPSVLTFGVYVPARFGVRCDANRRLARACGGNIKMIRGIVLA